MDDNSNLLEDNTKLFVFERKEVFLIFAFILILTVIAFTLGVNTGKKLSLKQDGYINEDIKTINLKSVDEEFVEGVVKEKTKKVSLNDELNGTQKTVSQEEMERKIRAEMEKLSNEKVIIEKPAEKKTEVIEDATSDLPTPSSMLGTPVAEPTENNDIYKTGDDYTGKYTIQVYSSQDKNLAQEFADGFLVKSYDVIINEVMIAGRGKWYRVSIGVFDSFNDAKAFLDKEKDLFKSSKDYMINQFE